MEDEIDKDLQSILRHGEVPFGEQPFAEDAIRLIRKADVQFRLLKGSIAILSLLAVALITLIVVEPLTYVLSMLNLGLSEVFIALSRPPNLLALLVALLMIRSMRAFVRRL